MTSRTPGTAAVPPWRPRQSLPAMTELWTDPDMSQPPCQITGQAETNNMRASVTGQMPFNSRSDSAIPRLSGWLESRDVPLTRAR